MKFRVIVNPTSGAGAARRRLEQLKNELAKAGLSHDIALTRAPGDATQLARRARDDGVELIGIVGGDGTVNEVAQAYLGPDGEPIAGPDLALIPAGTGGDFRRTFGLSKEPRDALERMLRAVPRAIDLGVVDLIGDDGGPLRKAFLNILSFGVAGKVDRIVNAGPKWIGGRPAFYLGTLRAMAVYRNEPVEVRVDAKPWFEGRIVNVAIANGQYFGGGMRVAPNADPSDGAFDVVALGDMTVAQTVGLTSKIYQGSHLSHEKVRATRGTLVEARPGKGRTVLVDLDGEAPGRLPLKARLVPSAVRIRA